MNVTLAKKTLIALASALACASVASSGALAYTGGVRAGRGHAKHRAHRSQIATWFGPGFYGQKTACGQTMTPVIVGVASRTLPCGTLVLVNYNGHRLTVPVIDRGPYAHNGATWDLTWGAASALTITDTVLIKTKIVGRTPNTPGLGVPVPVPLVGTAALSGGTAAG